MRHPKLEEKATIGDPDIFAESMPAPVRERALASCPMARTVELTELAPKEWRVPPAADQRDGEVRFSPGSLCECLRIARAGPGGRLRVQLPGILKRCTCAADETDGLRVVSVRVATMSEAADYLMAYLARETFTRQQA